MKRRDVDIILEELKDALSQRSVYEFWDLLIGDGGETTLKKSFNEVVSKYGGENLTILILAFQKFLLRAGYIEITLDTCIKKEHLFQFIKEAHAENYGKLDDEPGISVVSTKLEMQDNRRAFNEDPWCLPMENQIGIFNFHPIEKARRKKIASKSK